MVWKRFSALRRDESQGQPHGASRVSVSMAEQSGGLGIECSGHHIARHPGRAGSQVGFRVMQSGRWCRQSDNYQKSGYIRSHFIAYSWRCISISDGLNARIEASYASGIGGIRSVMHPWHVCVS